MTERIKKLMQLRKDQGWSQRKLAEILFVSQKTVETWEYNKYDPGKKNVRDIDDLLREYKII